MTKDFYDKMAPFYHLIYPDWERSIERQAAQLDQVIQENWGNEVQTILDVSCGIGTQALGLAQLKYQVTGSDLSEAAVERAKQEAQKRGAEIPFSVADMRQAYTHHQEQFEVVISCDNAVPHLLTDDDILQAFQQFFKCTQTGGGVIITVRDYQKEERRTQIKPEGVHRLEDGQRYILFQVWEFDGDIYEMSMYVVKDDGSAGCRTQVMRAKYYAVGTTRLLELLGEAGFEEVKRVDGAFYHPLLVGTRKK
jgi:SAM-dependent methyltransferase